MSLSTLLSSRKLPIILQMEAVECGPACLAMVMAYYGRHIPLPELRNRCGVSRDGSHAKRLALVAKEEGFEAHAYRVGADEIPKTHLPAILFWENQHFVVLSKIGSKSVTIYDPDRGKRVLSRSEFKASFSSVLLDIRPGEDFIADTRKESLQFSIRKALFPHYTKWLFLGLCHLGLIGTSFLFPILFGMTIDANQSHLYQSEVISLGLILVGNLAFFYFFSKLAQSFMSKFEFKLTYEWMRRFIVSLLQKPLPYFEQRQSSELISRLFLADAILGLTFRNTLKSLTLGIYAVLASVVLAIANPFILGAALSLSATYFFIFRLIDHLLADRRSNQAQERRRLSIFTSFKAKHIRNISASGMIQSFLRTWNQFISARFKAESKLETAQALSHTIRLAFPFLLSSTVIPLLMVHHDIRAISLAQIGFLEYLVLIIGFAASHFANHHAFTSIVNETQRLLEDVLVDTELPIHASELPNIGDEFSVTNLSFTYPHQTKACLNDITFSIPPQSRLFISGTESSGKSLLAEILGGQVQPSAGQLRIGGILIEDLPEIARSQAVMMIRPDVALFDGSIAENISLFNPTDFSEAEIRMAAKKALIHPRIQECSSGYDTEFLAHSPPYSQGEKILIQFARVFLYQPKLVIIDAAYDYLDHATRELLDANIRRSPISVIVLSNQTDMLTQSDAHYHLEENGHLTPIQKGKSS